MYIIAWNLWYCFLIKDAGSVDRLYLNGTPEPILAKIVISVLKALKFLKDEIQIIHRDVKPTNILVNSLGQCKLCDFGISGQLFQSLAKTNIGCQSYLAPERISVQEIGVFTSSCDVWSLGITAIEIALGYYPYPSDNFDSVFAQLNYIVVGEVPGLNEDYSKECRDFISLCLKKDPKIRANYKELVEHEWVKKWENEDVDVATWVKGALESNVNEVRISSSYPL